MIVLAAACVIAGIFGAGMLAAVAPVVRSMFPFDSAVADGVFATASAVLWKVSAFVAVLIAIAALLALLRRRLLAGRTVETTGTWDCGYVAPTARMQYTASSFAWPILGLFR